MFCFYPRATFPVPGSRVSTVRVPPVIISVINVQQGRWTRPGWPRLALTEPPPIRRPDCLHPRLSGRALFKDSPKTRTSAGGCTAVITSTPSALQPPDASIQPSIHDKQQPSLCSQRWGGTRKDVHWLKAFIIIILQCLHSWRAELDYLLSRAAQRHPANDQLNVSARRSVYPSLSQHVSPPRRRNDNQNQNEVRTASWRHSHPLVVWSDVRRSGRLGLKPGAWRVV